MLRGSPRRACRIKVGTILPSSSLIGDKPGSSGQEDPHLRRLRHVLCAKPRVAFEPVPETRTRSKFWRNLRGPGSAVPNPTLLWRGLYQGSVVWDRLRGEAGGRSRFASQRAL